MLRTVLVRFGGAPRDASRFYYRDLALAPVFVFCSLAAVISGWERTFSPAFWICSGIAGMSLLAARNRRVLVGALFGFAALRFSIGFFLYRELFLLALAAVCAVIGLMVVWRANLDYPDTVNRKNW